jgi:hypothetical protein
MNDNKPIYMAKQARPSYGSIGGNNSILSRIDSSRGPPAEEEESFMSDAVEMNAIETKRLVLKFPDGAYLYGVKSQSEDSWVELKNGN